MLNIRQMQQLVEDTAAKLSIPISFIDEKGNIIASSHKEQINTTDRALLADTDTWLKDGSGVRDGAFYYAIYLTNYKPLYLRLDGQGEVVRRYCYLLEALLESYDKMPEQHLSQEQFMHKLLMDRMAPGDVSVYLDDYRIERKLNRCVFLIVTTGKEEQIYRILSKAFPKSRRDIVVRMDARDIVLIKAIDNDDGDDTAMDDLIQLGQAIAESILNELSIKVQIGIGGIKDDVLHIKDSYAEARRAIDIGKAFDNGKGGLYVYDKLFIEKLLFHTPVERCQEFYNRVFKGDEFDFLNEAMIQTVQKFFENNLNLSETSRQLYIHRNTLVYRLDKIQKYTGLDLRKFDDAVTFKLCLMLGRYLGYIKN